MEMDDLMSELLPIYVGELREHVKRISQELLALEKEKDRSARAQRLIVILRTIHSLKGASRSVGLATAASVCHEMETFLAMAEEETSLKAEDYQILFKVLDAIEAMGQLLQAGDKNAERPLTPLLFTLKDHRGKLESVLPEEHKEGTIKQKVEEQLANQAPTRIIDNSVRLPLNKLDSLMAEGLNLITIANRNAACMQSIDQLQRTVRSWQRQAKKENKSMGSEGERLRQLSKELEHARLNLRNENRQLGSAVSHVAGGINGLRMVPLGQACQGMDRIVRDLTVNGTKEIQLEFHGMDTEVDRNVLEQIKDPLMHLVRNCCDHGVETVEERINKGKPEKATITISASLSGSQAQITISDDGRGVSLDAVRARARKQALPEPENESEMKALLFAKGFSTASIITESSGRGIGLDVVKDRIEGLHGSVELRTEDNKGTTFVINVPLTTTSMRVLFVRAGGQLFGIATTSIQRLLRVAPNDFGVLEGQTVLSLGESPRPVVSLAQILELQPSPQRPGKTPSVVLASGESHAVVVVDEFLSEQEVLVSGLGRRIKRVKYIAGSTILPDGKIVLIVNSSEIMRAALNPAMQMAEQKHFLDTEETKPRRLLLVDDSITTRSIEKNLLETAGFDVTTCADGLQAWQVLQEKQFDIVVTDVEMPNMDGFALTRKIKSSAKHCRLPVILVTALESERHKALGIASGADAYLIKSEVERSALLDVINQLV